MKKSALLLCAILLVSLLAGCGGDQAAPDTATSNLTGSAQDVLTAIWDQTDLETFMTFDEAATSETCQSYLGLTPEQFEEYAEEAYVSSAAITTHAHLTAVIKCADESAASAVKDLIASGFDSGRWICVRPEQSFVAASGSYVFLASTDNATAEALQAGLNAASGTETDINAFYTGEA